MLEQNENTVQDIMFNHISINDYENDFIYSQESPKQILEYIQETKLGERGLDEHTAFEKLITIEFDPKKETAREYCNRFEIPVRLHGNHCKTGNIQMIMSASFSFILWKGNTWRSHR